MFLYLKRTLCMLSVVIFAGCGGGGSDNGSNNNNAGNNPPSINQPIGNITDTDNAENTVVQTAPIGTAVGITARAADPDGETVTYSLSNTAQNQFTIGNTTGVVSVNAALTAGNHTITVVATSSDESTSNEDFSINVFDDADGANNAIGNVTDNDNAPNTVVRNAAVGTSVGITALAVDPDDGDTVTYSLTNSAQERFAINTNTGRVTVNNSPLDPDVYEITIRATSSDGTRSDITLDITVTVDQSESISLLFPNGGLYEGNEIDVYGQFSDDVVIDDAVVVTVTAGEQMVQADINRDDRTWRASNVPLGATGDKTISVVLHNNLGDGTIETALTVIGPMLSSEVTDMEPYGDEALLLDRGRRAIIAMNPQTKIKRIVSDNNHGTGDAFEAPQTFAVDSENNVAYVVDRSRSAIYRVNLLNGNRDVIFDREDSGNLSLFQTEGIVLYDGRLIFHYKTSGNSSKFYTITTGGDSFQQLGDDLDVDIVDMDLDQSSTPKVLIATTDDNILALNINDGTGTPLTNAGDETQGPLLDDLRGITFAANRGVNGEIYAMTGTDGGSIIRINSDGTRTLASDNSDIFDGPNIYFPKRIVFANNQYVVMHSSTEFLSINFDDGKRQLISKAYSRGTDDFSPVFVLPQWLDVFTDTGNVIVSGLELIGIDSTGHQDSLSFRSDDYTAKIKGIDLDNEDKYIYSATRVEDKSVVRFDADGANPEVITTDDSLNPQITPVDVALDKANNRLLITNHANGLVAVDLRNGERTLLSKKKEASGDNRGVDEAESNTEFRPESLIYDSEEQRAYVLESNRTSTGIANRYTLTGVDAAPAGSGDRKQLLKAEDGSEFVDLTLDSKRNRILLTDRGPGFFAVRAVDLDTEETNIVSSTSQGTGTPLCRPFGISVDAERDRIWVSDASMGALFMIDPISGDRVVVSR